MSNTQNNVKEGAEFNPTQLKGWYKEQIVMAKLRTELAELMCREAKATAERLHYLGSIAAMQGEPGPVNKEETSEKSSQETASEEPQQEAVVRSISE